MHSPRPHLPADERRAITVQAVVELAATRNPGDITTAAIAEHMKLTQGALFRHFPTKDALWEAVMQWVTDHLMACLDQAAQDAASPLDALQAMFMSHVDFIVEYPGAPRMMFGELQHATSTPAKEVAKVLIKRYSEIISAQLEVGKQAGEINRDVQTQAAATLFIGSIQGLVMQSMLVGDIQRIKAQAPGVFALYKRGLLAPSSGGNPS